ncbi:MAG: small ribosomal subunit biogenesis GTPase RsgA [Synechococcales bacterium]|nr:small ribosomal subunit biogenesis GTPase RsgA [Synechococcales bacterium]
MISAQITGIVIAVQANYYWVKCDRIQGDLDQGDRNSQSSSALPQATLLCTRRDRLRKMGQKVMVGDRVTVEEINWDSQRAAICQVLPRQTELDRPPVANADQILLVFAFAQPAIDPVQLSRFLVKAETSGIKVQLCLTKCDLVSPDIQQQWRDRLMTWSYDPILISVYQHQGLETLRQRLSDRITVVSGPSGVGKSSLINALLPQLKLRVSSVSGKLERGRHTTRHVELFQLASGGLLADTPGFNQPDLDCAPIALAHCFPEVRSRLQQNSCQFSDCLHRDEPGCGVRGSWERYDLYLKFLDDAIAYQTKLRQQTEPEAILKAKTSANGKINYEMRLDRSKYRRESRKTRQQSMQVMKGKVIDWLEQEPE